MADGAATPGPREGPVQATATEAKTHLEHGIRPSLPLTDIAGTYTLVKKLGNGSFGEVFLATHVRTGEEVAVKLESADAMHPQLAYEAKLLRFLKSTGVSKVHYSGLERQYNVLVMDLLGKSLEDCLTACGGTFSLKTCLLVAGQVLQRIEYLHSKGFVHRDIKPENFLTGRGREANTVYVIDFGLSKYFVDPKSREHIPYRDGKSLTGTARYASINAHRGVEQSRRDDLEAIGHMLVYFAKGSLPWQGLPAKTKDEKYRRIRDKKISTSVTDLCAGLPAEFPAYLQYVRSLRFTDRPDYDQLRAHFAERFHREGCKLDGICDWTGLGEEPSEVGAEFGRSRRVRARGACGCFGGGLRNER